MNNEDIKKGFTLSTFLLVLAGAGLFLSLFSRLLPSPREYSRNVPVGASEDEKIVSSNEFTSDSATSSASLLTKSVESMSLLPPITTPPVETHIELPSEALPTPSLLFVPPAVQKDIPAPAPVASPVPSLTVLPPLNEAALFKAVVKIECLSADGLGKYIGSGFVIEGNQVVTAAHVVMDSGSETCTVIFPSDRQPSHYLRGTLVDFKDIRGRHDEKGIDVAILALPPLETYPEGRAIFEKYPAIPYPICSTPLMIGDALFHFGYPSNYVDQNYLSVLVGQSVRYADITGIQERLSEDNTFTFKSPIFSFTSDQSQLHAYMVSRVASFYGDSGGLAFNKTKQCIIGPHRGGTIGGGAGENYSIFMVLGWEGIASLLEP